MKTSLAFFNLFLGTISLATADPSAAVTEAVNRVSHGSSQSTASYPAKVGTVLHDGEYLKTGALSRAELELSNQTITRLGANTIFNYSAAANEVDLQTGAILFSKPKDGQTLKIKTEAVTAAIVGTTGFLQVHGQNSHATFSFGIIEGKAEAQADGKSFIVLAGQLLNFTPGSAPQVVDFDIPLLVKTSPLIHGFHHPLPNQSYVDAEIVKYDDLVQRGFIRPPQFPYIVFDANHIPIIAFDSAGNALSNLNRPPEAPSRGCGYPGYPSGPFNRFENERKRPSL